MALRPCLRAIAVCLPDLVPGPSVHVSDGAQLAPARMAGWTEGSGQRMILDFGVPRRVQPSRVVQMSVSQGSCRSQAAKGATLRGDRKGISCPRSLHLSGSLTLRRPLFLSLDLLSPTSEVLAPPPRPVCRGHPSRAGAEQQRPCPHSTPQDRTSRSVPRHGLAFPRGTVVPAGAPACPPVWVSAGALQLTGSGAVCPPTDDKSHSNTWPVT